ncbi:MAG: hypothetical protein HQL82_02835 [Magnetococcales bacterium]|nr:hypothetical protein [Magnetococcales bacterium]
MINTLQGVNGFGVANPLQDQASMQRAIHDITTNDGRELEARHVERAALREVAKRDTQKRDQAEAREKQRDAAQRSPLGEAREEESSQVERAAVEARERMNETRQKAEEFLLGVVAASSGAGKTAEAVHAREADSPTVDLKV